MVPPCEQKEPLNLRNPSVGYRWLKTELYLRADLG